MNAANRYARLSRSDALSVAQLVLIHSVRSRRVVYLTRTRTGTAGTSEIPSARRIHRKPPTSTRLRRRPPVLLRTGPPVVEARAAAVDGQQMHRAMGVAVEFVTQRRVEISGSHEPRGRQRSQLERFRLLRRFGDFDRSIGHFDLDRIEREIRAQVPEQIWRHRLVQAVRAGVVRIDRSR